MSSLRLCVISLRYSSWSMRPWLALQHAGADFVTDTVDITLGRRPADDADDDALRAFARSELAERRAKGSVTGLYPVLHVDGTAIHESLAICEWVNEAFPEAGLYPEDSLARARARAISSEMVGGFSQLRSTMTCHLFGRVHNFQPTVAAHRDITRVFELWDDALQRTGGPFLFGRFGIADAMFYPVRTRFRTYGVDIPRALQAYAHALDQLPAVHALVERARQDPACPSYDAALRALGGDPTAALNA